MNLANKDEARIKRDKAKDAITLALASRWKEAVTLNREIVSDSPRDVEAYNRLGKALSELGQYKGAKDAFRQTLEISPANGIAKKNLQRLAQLNEAAAIPKQGTKVTPELFIEERGKSTTISLMKLPADGAHLRMAPGDSVELQESVTGLTVGNPEGQYLGEVEPRIGQRLAKLIQGGNIYAAAVTSVREQNLVVMIKETYQHRSQYGTVSFPNKQPSGGVYSYLGAPPLPAELDLEEEEIELDRPPIIDWDEEGEASIAAPPSDHEVTPPSPRDDLDEQASF
jgi:tetratricopeptide (TPR) repeat protein